MTRVNLKSDSDIYRVILNQHTVADLGRTDNWGDPIKEPTDQIVNTWIEGPYDTKSAANGRLTAQTSGHCRQAHPGKVQVIQGPEWEDLK